MLPQHRQPQQREGRPAVGASQNRRRGSGRPHPSPRDAPGVLHLTGRALTAPAVVHEPLLATSGMHAGPTDMRVPQT